VTRVSNLNINNNNNSNNKNKIIRLNKFVRIWMIFNIILVKKIIIIIILINMKSNKWNKKMNANKRNKNCC
jgi:hypothetical protein